jgi:hypothetical protein
MTQDMPHVLAARPAVTLAVLGFVQRSCLPALQHLLLFLHSKACMFVSSAMCVLACTGACTPSGSHVWNSTAEAWAWRQQLKLLPLTNWCNACVPLQFLEAPADADN